MRKTTILPMIFLLGCQAHTAAKTAQASPPSQSTAETGGGGSDAQAPAPAEVHGSLDKEVIRTAIRAHLGEVKACYEPELAKNPNLDGKVMVQFTIAKAGNVVAAVVQNSTLNNTVVENCVTSAVRGWEFPKPVGGGIVVVSYPFILKYQPKKSP